ncbi:MAG TPA: 5'/3'-nucleotidase SurE [Chitinophagales bacterium]|nr:5'/3'-nucleotidase SurE [Chitinophagales bacterium]
MSKPMILVTNDDGIVSPGIKALVEAVQKFGDVVVVAPDSPQSGMGHAITIHEPLRLQKVNQFGDIPSYQCSGTPVDCVKIAIDKILHRKPDLCVSGINHGSNAAINVIYSGTMSAAMEAAIDGIPAVGFSLLDFSFEADFSASKFYVEKVVEQILAKGMPSDSLLNVNIPKLPLSEIKGMRICRQSNAKWVEEFDERTDPNGKNYYWLTGKFVNFDQGDDTDVWALENGYVSIVPVQYDLTHHHAISFINQNWKLHD